MLKYKELQTIIAMITEHKVFLFVQGNSRIILYDRWFLQVFWCHDEKYTLKKADKKQQYHPNSTTSKAEIILIMILFHDSGYRCLKHFYLEKVCKHMRHLYLSILCLFVSITYKMITRLTSKETLTYTLAVISSPALYEYPSSGGGIVEGCGARIFSEIHR